MKFNCIVQWTMNKNSISVITTMDERFKILPMSLLLKILICVIKGNKINLYHKNNLHKAYIRETEQRAKVLYPWQPDRSYCSHLILRNVLNLHYRHIRVKATSRSFQKTTILSSLKILQPARDICFSEENLNTPGTYVHSNYFRFIPFPKNQHQNLNRTDPVI